MRNELNNLVTQVQDPQTRKVLFHISDRLTTFPSIDSEP